MSEFIKHKNYKDSILKSEIIRVSYAVSRGGEAIFNFTLRNGKEICWDNYYEAEAKQLIESL